MCSNFSLGTQSQILLLGSYEISELFAESNYPYTIAKELVAPENDKSLI